MNNNLILLLRVYLLNECSHMQKKYASEESVCVCVCVCVCVNLGVNHHLKILNGVPLVK